MHKSLGWISITRKNNKAKQDKTKQKPGVAGAEWAEKRMDGGDWKGDTGVASK